MNKLLVPLLIIALIVVVVLLWQAGMLDGGTATSSAPTTEQLTSAPADAPAAPEPVVDAGPTIAPPLDLSEDRIQGAADALLAQVTPDFSNCALEADNTKALECAAAAQSAALTAAFDAHNALRDAGDEISVQRGGEIMQKVIDVLQRQLEPFVQAADGV